VAAFGEVQKSARCPGWFLQLDQTGTLAPQRAAVSYT